MPLKPWTPCTLQREFLTEVCECLDEKLELINQTHHNKLTTNNSPANKRKHAAFSHRLCVRVATDDRTLSITDLGAGMTRADLINALGVGRLSIRAFRTSKRLWKEGDGGASSTEDDEIDEEGSSKFEDPTEEVEGDEEEEEDNDEEDDEEAIEINEEPVDEGLLPCKASDVGGFYSSLCALGKGITVGTKVRRLTSVEDSFAVSLFITNPIA